MYMLEGKHCATPLQEGAQMMGYKTRRGGPDRPVLVSNSTTYSLPPFGGKSISLASCRCRSDG